MSTQPVPAKDSPKPQLTAEYKRVQKVYVLVAAGLSFWQIFAASVDLSKYGINVPNGSKAGPYILGIALAYLCYKFIIEWKENDAASRENPASRLDFWVTHCLAVGAVLTVVQQHIARAKIGAALARHSSWLMLATLLAVTFTVLLFLWYTTLSGVRAKILGGIPLLVMLATTVGLLIYTVRVKGAVSAGLAVVLGIAPILAIGLALVVFLIVILLIGIANARRKDDDDDMPSPLEVLGQ